MQERTVAPTTLTIKTLGEACVLHGSEPLTWSARSAEELLWYLHAHPDGAYRTELLAELWEEEDSPAVANRFRVALHRLRATLGRSDAVLEQRGRYHLHPELYAASDTGQLQTALAEARQADTHEAREAALRRAVACGDGDYLPHLRVEWVQEARRSHRQAQLRAHLGLSALYCAQRECALAAQVLTQAVTSDPLIGEDHHQRLMTCLAQTQGRFRAVEHYRRYRLYLREEIGDTPMPDTVQLAERLKAGERPCADADGLAPMLPPPG